MTVAKEVSPEAVVIATLEIAYGILRHLVQRKIMTEAEVAKLLSAAAKSQREVGAVLPANEEAATVLDEMAEGESGKWRQFVRVLRDPK